MRNIKTTLRIVRNSALLFAAASGMSYLTACSENDITPDNGDNNGNEDIVLVEQLGLTVGTNPNLAKTYRNSHQPGTRGVNDLLNHPGMPAAPTAYVASLPEGYNGQWINVELPKDAKESDYQNLGTQDSVPVYVPAGTYGSLPAEITINYKHEWATADNGSWQHQAKITNPLYYIDDKVSTGGFGGDSKLQIHILNGGEFSTSTEFEVNNKVYLYKGGKLLRSRNENEIYLKCKLYAEEDIYDDDVTITIPGEVYTYGKIHGKKVETINSGKLFAGCAVTAVEEIYLTNNSLISAGYVSAPYIKLDSNTQVELRAGGYMHATETLSLQNVGTLTVFSEEVQDGEFGPAMVETEELNVNNKDLTGVFYNVGVKYSNQTGTEEKTADQDYVVLDWNQSTQVYWVNKPVTDNEDVKPVFNYSVADGDECAPKVVVETVEPTPGPTLENIGSVAPTEGHSHPISATCIYTNGQDAYLSWHTQGSNFHGCIEYLTVANGNVTLNAYLETAPSNNVTGAIDFNHVIFDNSKIFVAGDHPSKGGILGWIECNNGGFVTGEATLNLRQLYNGKKGGSGNCIIRNGNYYQVASIHGFETYNVSDFVGAAKPKAVAQLAAYDFDPAGEEATGRQTGKHIAIGGGKVAMLTLINRDNELNTATASIKVYNASDVKYENEVASYIINDAVLSPVDGKDVIAINGDDIWVCLGQGGVQHLRVSGNTISKVSEFVLTKMSKDELKGWNLSTKEAAASCANGLAVDNKYVYVAHGGAGLVVLNKEDLSPVTHTRHNAGKSANYVNLNPDGYIYVAYGKSNVQVFAWKK